VGPTGNVLMIDANQVWDVPQAIEYVKGLAEIRPWFIGEPTAPDEYVLPLYLSVAFVPFFLATVIVPDDLRVVNSILGNACIRRELKPSGIGVATGEHAHNRMMFKRVSSGRMKSMSFGLTHVVSPVSVTCSLSSFWPPSVASPYVRTPVVWDCASMSFT